MNTTPQAALLSDDEIVKHLEAAGVKFQRFMGVISGKKEIWSTSGSQDVRKLANGVRAILAKLQAAQAEPVQPIDAEALIRACLPGGLSCDPQQVADEIRRYLKQWQEPVQAGELPDERAAFEAEMRCSEEWGHRSLKKRTNGKYKNWQVDLMWDVWQARAALSARKPAVRGDLTPDRIFGLADVHAEESREDGMRIFDRGGLIGFAMDAARIGSYPAKAPLTKPQIKDLAKEEELLLLCDGIDSLEDIVSVIERAHGIGLEVK